MVVDKKLYLSLYNNLESKCNTSKPLDMSPQADLFAISTVVFFNAHLINVSFLKSIEV